MDYDAYDAILHRVFKQTQGDAWFKPSEENISAGVCLRVETGHFRVFPYENRYLEPFEAAVRALNPVVAVKLRSAAIHAALSTLSDEDIAIYVDSNTRIQVLDTMAHLAKADKEQCAAFIRDECVLIVWSDNLDFIIPNCHDFDDKLIKLVWRVRPLLSAANSTLDTPSLGATPSSTSLAEKHAIFGSESIPSTPTSEPRKLLFGWRSRKVDTPKKVSDHEAGAHRNPRPTRLFAAVYTGFGAALSIYFVANGVSMLLKEYLLDGGMMRFVLVATTPFLFCVSLFFSLQVVTNISFVLGPVAQYHENSKYYSAVAPEPNKEVDNKLPHVTIQMPVYKESLEMTITPSVESLKKAMVTYARQGGTSSIFINDDGMQLLSEQEREARIEFYANHGIGWVARPAHDSKNADGFKRAGRFKKASNMNYALALSLKLEKCLKTLEEDEKANLRHDEDEDDTLEEKALAMAIEEVFAESGERFKPWASNAKAIRVGEIILLVDSDTVVPEDCFRDAARELHESHEVAIIQHESDVMMVAHHYFERGIAHFTRRINKCISMSCANGEVAAFVGHNAFLRWSAIQDAAFIDRADGFKKIWSEANVSEDFDMALRLQMKGYAIRWASYSGGGFKEGVSLTCDDELNRWQKYAYGCNELIFNPFVKWFRQGPINKQLHVFIWSSAPIHYKISMLAYMFSYYGIAASVTLSLLNYILLGFALPIDGFYASHSFEVWLACVVVFPGAGNIGFTLLEYRLGTRSLLDSFVENFTWVPFFFFFFGGLSIHLSQALLAHLFSYNITWGATKKEVERSNFFLEVPKILRRFWLSLVLSGLISAIMIVLSTPLVPIGWRVQSSDWAVLFPLAIVVGCHVLYPIVLNPWLLLFSY